MAGTAGAVTRTLMISSTRNDAVLELAVSVLMPWVNCNCAALLMDVPAAVPAAYEQAQGSNASSTHSVVAANRVVTMPAASCAQARARVCRKPGD